MAAIHSVDASSDELASFQHSITHLFQQINIANTDSILSLSLLTKLLHSFLASHHHFRTILLTHRQSSPPSPNVNKHISDFFDRVIKALDLLNAVRDGISRLRHWRRHLEIVLTALGPGPAPLGPGQLRRAHKALADLTLVGTGSGRNRSFCRGGGGGGGLAIAAARSLSWSVSRTQQVQGMAAAPRNQDIAASHGLAALLYTMSCVIWFVSWVLVAAIPCEERWVGGNFTVSRSYPWAGAMMEVHQRVVEEGRKRGGGLLRERREAEKCARRLMEMIEKSGFRVEEEGVVEREVRREVEELRGVCEAMKEGLDPLECQVREVFQHMVRCRMEALNPAET